MKRQASIVVAAALLAASSLAGANSRQLAPVTVHRSAVAAADCTPPNASKACAEFHAAIRRHFSNREIGMLFGAAAAFPESRSSFDRVRSRYAAFVRDTDEAGFVLAGTLR